ncbi:hypothetical protein PHAVU_L003437 [Phaseolus vulgaris]|uniref:Uncharacterized protein n=1 Tax=Phaseolus vulgaris TaxID=3885 RepID=A0ACC3P2I2_PHAVU
MMDEIKEKSTQKEVDLLRAMEDLKKRENELSKIVGALQDDVASSFIVGFEVVKDQAVVFHPSIDLSDINPCKTVVDGKIVDGA